MPTTLTWKSVFFIWMLAMPFMAGAGFVAYMKYPAPFKASAALALKEYKVGQKWHSAYKASRAKEDAAAARKAKEEEASGSGF